MKFNPEKSAVPFKVVYAAKATITIALTCFIALTLMTIVAIDRSRDRTTCYRAAQAPETCSTPSWWEIILRRSIGPST
ncbi:hypothetical protein OKW11_006349 [Pseudomonas baetica]|nr:hypothetical protein [Pseudomonas baetica]